MANAGRILIMPKGNYDASKTYEMLDLVNHNGVSWLAKKTVTGIAPSDGEYWHPLLGITIANNLDTVAEGKVLDARQGKVLADELKTKTSRVLLWEGAPVALGHIFCEGQDKYDRFELYCDDGYILQGFKVYNSIVDKYQLHCGYCGMIVTGDGSLGHGSYAGVMDVYDTHFYSHGFQMLNVYNNDVVTGKTISKIYGIA